MDGAIHTGLNRNITVDFSYAAGASLNSTSTPAIVSDNSAISFTQSTKLESSDLVTEYDSTQSQLATYKALQVQYGTANADPTLAQEITFDQQELQSLQTQLLSQGLGEIESDGSFVITQRSVDTIDIAPFKAEAGQIYLFGGHIGGTGTLDAPIGVNVAINNYTLSTLEIEGIYIPQNIGGIYANGLVLDYGSVSGDNYAINAVNIGAPGLPAANFASVTTSPAPAPPAPGTPASAAISITNFEQLRIQGQQSMASPAGATQPDVIVNGVINALFASVSITSNNDIDITGSGSVSAYSESFQSKNNITIDEISTYNRRRIPLPT